MNVLSKRKVDDELAEARLRLRHAAFALAGSSASVVVEDRTMADDYLTAAARQFVLAEAKAGHP